MNFKSMIEIFRGDDSDALGYQTIVGTIHTDLDLSGCKAVFRYLGFFQEFDPIPEDGKITIVIPSASSKTFPPGLGYASLRIYDVDRKVRTFTNRIPVLVSTMTPSCGCGKFDIRFSPFPELEPLKIFIGPNADDFDQYTGFISKIIDRASLEKYGLVMLADAMGEDGGESGKAASPLAVKAAYDAIIAELTDNYYTAEETDEAIDKLAAYYITYTTNGAAFPTRAALLNAETYYSGGAERTPTRNDYAVVLADETHDGAEYRYIYAVAEGQTTGSWEAQYPVGGVMTIDQAVTKNSDNPVKSAGIWSALWGALTALPTGFLSLYDWCVAQLAGKLDKSGGTVTGDIRMPNGILDAGDVQTRSMFDFLQPDQFTKSLDAPENSGKALTDADISDSSSALGTALAGKLSTSGGTMTGGIAFGTEDDYGYLGLAYDDETHHLRIIDVWNENTAYLEVPNTADGSRVAFTSDVDNAIAAAVPYALGTPTVIDTASSETVDGETVNYGAATLANRTANIVQVTAATALDELRIAFPAATSGKVRDFGLRVEIGTGSAALAAPALVPIAPTGETIKIENADGTIPELADGTATAKGVTLLYFSENAPGVFVVKGEQVEEVA